MWIAEMGYLMIQESIIDFVSTYAPINNFPPRGGAEGIPWELDGQNSQTGIRQTTLAQGRYLTCLS